MHDSYEVIILMMILNFNHKKDYDHDNVQDLKKHDNNIITTIYKYTFVVTKVRWHTVTDIANYILTDLYAAGPLRLAILLRSGGFMFQLCLIVYFDF